MEKETRLYDYYGPEALPKVEEMFERIANKFGLNFYEHDRFNPIQFRTDSIVDSTLNDTKRDFMVVWYHGCFKFTYRLDGKTTSSRFDENLTPKYIEEFVEAYLKQSKEYKIKKNLEEINKDFE